MTAELALRLIGLVPLCLFHTDFLEIEGYNTLGIIFKHIADKISILQTSNRIFLTSTDVCEVGYIVTRMYYHSEFGSNKEK